MLEEINDLLTQIDMMLVNLKEKNEQLQIEYEMIIAKLEEAGKIVNELRFGKD